jgi:hypothetical protein
MGNYHVRFLGGGSCVSWVPSSRREGRYENDPLSNLILLREIHHWLSNYLVMPF